MFCNACGCEVNTTGRFCSHCGRSLPPQAGAGAARIPLERPRQGRKVAGVCLGIANNLNLDVTLVRVLWVVISVLGGVVAYAAAWILIPEEPLRQLTSGSPQSAVPNS